MTPTTPDHLTVENSSRRLGYLPRIASEYGGHVDVYESSSAKGPHVWLTAEAPANLNKLDGPTVSASMHLTAENAWHLADQLRMLVREHYQGDATPVLVEPLRELAEWLVSLDSPGSLDRRGVRLADIIGRAREALDREQ